MLLTRLRSIVRNVIRRDRVERDLDDEMRAALDVLEDEHRRAGMSPAEARRMAMLEIGGIESVKQQVRDVRGGALIETLIQDVRYASRVLRRSPLFTVTAVLSLAIGIAGTVVVFSLADSYLFRNRPGVAEANRLAEVGRIDAGEDGGFYSGDGFDTFSYPNYLDIPRTTDSLCGAGRISRRGYREVRAWHVRQRCACTWRVRVGQLLHRAGCADRAWTRFPAGRGAAGESQVPSPSSAIGSGRRSLAATW